MRVLPVLCALILAGPADARCVKPGDLDTGIIFAREGAYTGRARALADGSVELDYNIGGGGSNDVRTAWFGIYENQITKAPEAGTVGWIAYQESQSFNPAPVEPVAGGSWQGKIRRVSTGGGPVIEDAPPARTQRIKTRYDFLPPMDVTISHCPYTVIPVEAHFTMAGGEEILQRWLYFPALGFGIETIPRGSSVREGLTLLKPAP